jgi:hypothetical protein
MGEGSFTARSERSSTLAQLEGCLLRRCVTAEHMNNGSTCLATTQVHPHVHGQYTL